LQRTKTLKKMKKISILICFLLFVNLLFAHIHGIVLDEQGEPLPGANIYWANTTKGAVSNANGLFEIEPVKSTKLLVTSFMGFRNDTTDLSHSHEHIISIVLVDNLLLDEVIIQERKMSVLKSKISAINVEKISSSEICRAACCNLSESFETSASVDVAYSDATTGAKQIRLLGLSGNYLQLLTENIPAVRGLAQNFGLEYIPGPWMESIQVSKGASSVINGYESTTGQINVEYLKPQVQDPVSINAILSSELQAEVNIEGAAAINEQLSTGVLAHYQIGQLEMDDNHDGFNDLPRNHQLNLLNRWYYKKDNYTLQFLLHGIYDQRIGGQTSKTISDPLYIIDLRTRRLEGFLKNGYIINDQQGMSIGIIAAASYHSQTNIYGEKKWDVAQTNAYLNAIFQTHFEEGHKLSVGLSINFDKYNEQLAFSDHTLLLDRVETTPGLFAEYTYNYEEKLSLIAGIRGDYSTLYGAFCTPRFNIRYAPAEWVNMRASIGMGYRSPNLITDYASFLSSNRQWELPQTLKQEKALNTGANITFYIPIANQQLQLSGEYYYTKFLECVIADIDNDTHRAILRNLSSIDNGHSFAHTWQIETSMEILKGWTMTLAYRQSDIKQTSFSSVENTFLLRDKPLNNKFKGIITTSYQTPKKTWQFDFTAQFNGNGRMPDGFSIPEGSNQYYLIGNNIYHKWYPQLLAQVTTYFHSCSIYIGAENMTNYRQDEPVVSANNPWADDFDASLVWAPVHRWKVYFGFRWALEKMQQ